MRRGVLFNHGVLLGGLFLVLGVFPFLPDRGVLKFLLSGFITVVLLGLVFATLHRPRLRWAVGLLVAGAVALRWAGDFVEMPLVALVAQQALGAAAVAVSCIAILADVVRAERVTPAKISGALSVYLLLGYVWGIVFTILETVQPGSFNLALGDVAAGSRGEILGHLLYYSFITLSTLGYGDITPLSDGARSLAALEAVTGQIYLAVLVARLVGLQISQRGSGPS
jgi:hypothetical protein